MLQRLHYEDRERYMPPDDELIKSYNSLRQQIEQISSVFSKNRSTELPKLEETKEGLAREFLSEYQMELPSVQIDYRTRAMLFWLIKGSIFERPYFGLEDLNSLENQNHKEFIYEWRRRSMRCAGWLLAEKDRILLESSKIAEVARNIKDFLTPFMTTNNNALDDLLLTLCETALKLAWTLRRNRDFNYYIYYPEENAILDEHFCEAKDTFGYVKEIRAAVAAEGRDPQHIKIFPQMCPIIGRTLEEAQAKYNKFKAQVDVEAGMAKLGQYLDVDLSILPPDEPFDISSVGKSESSIHTMINMLKRCEGEGITPRQLGEKMAFCGFGPMPVGTPEMVADVMEDWANNGDVDGFNLAYVSNPESYEDIVELLVPVLQERGLMWKDYAVPGGTYWENMLRTLGQKVPPPGHPSTKFRYDVLKEKYADANGDITINK
ncbi:hypothetical protein G7Y89_g11481 [Cudoniella acicularis]|uniref:Uncharacterized protein n=1 Tax=Cudoniella acicularis TaxID=354080 RepID=A0A8H4RAR5_9HELO|nr:hypothetical protein G7Y89_g11481 [Cudoniella acicularis]